MARKVFPGDFSSLSPISAFIQTEAEAIGFDENEVYQIQLALDEACSNIIEHGYGGEGIGSITIETSRLPSGITITVEDDAEAFDPGVIPEPKVGAPLEDLGSRGAGLFLMKKIMDDVAFEFPEGGGTILRMSKMRSEA